MLLYHITLVRYPYINNNNNVIEFGGRVSSNFQTQCSLIAEQRVIAVGTFLCFSHSVIHGGRRKTFLLASQKQKTKTVTPEISKI